MIFKIYIGISILCFILLCLYNASLIHEAKVKYADKLKETEIIKVKKDIAGNIYLWLKMVIVCFIPIYNMFLIFILLFWSDKMKSISDQMLKNAFEKEK